MQLTELPEDDVLLDTVQGQRLLDVSNGFWYGTLVKDPRFPRPIRIAGKSKRWRSELRAYAEMLREPADAS